MPGRLAESSWACCEDSILVMGHLLGSISQKAGGREKGVLGLCQLYPFTLPRLPEHRMASATHIRWDF